VISMHSTLTFYQSSFPQAAIQVINKRKEGGQVFVDPKLINQKTKNEIMNEIKCHVAAQKIAKAIKSMIRVKRAIKERIKQEAIKAQLRICRMLTGKLYRRLFKRKILLSTLYLETPDIIIDRKARVYLFGNFTRLQWKDKLECKYDPYFKCFKCDKVRIMIGHVFKFVINDSRFVTSTRYPVLKDNLGNTNNIYDPRRIRKPLPKIKNQYPHVAIMNPGSN
jgi:hypothetical protein